MWLRYLLVRVGLVVPTNGSGHPSLDRCQRLRCQKPSRCDPDVGVGPLCPPPCDGRRICGGIQETMLSPGVFGRVFTISFPTSTYSIYLGVQRENSQPLLGEGEGVFQHRGLAYGGHRFTPIDAAMPSLSSVAKRSSGVGSSASSGSRADSKSIRPVKDMIDVVPSAEIPRLSGSWGS